VPVEWRFRRVFTLSLCVHRAFWQQLYLLLHSISTRTSEEPAMSDLIFLGLIVAIYAVAHASVIALARLGRIE
jgi:hypothetical protein